ASNVLMWWFLKHLDRAQQNRSAHDAGMKLDEGAQHVRPIRVAQEDEPVWIEPIARYRTLDKGRERLRFVADILLIEARLTCAAEPAIASFLRGPATNSE